jgi:hypothetical protein
MAPWTSRISGLDENAMRTSVTARRAVNRIDRRRAVREARRELIC